MIQRAIEKKLLSDVKPQKVVLLLGARRVGKTVLMEKLTREYGDGMVFLNGEDFTTLEMLSARTISSYTQLFQGVKLLAIDEAQNIPDIGNILKLIVDHIQGLSVIVSGSSSFDLYNMAREPLVGRSNHHMLYPFSLKELSQEESGVETMQLLEERLIYGMYPELVHIPDFDKKKQYLLEIVNSYLLKDILMIDGIKNSSKITYSGRYPFSDSGDTRSLWV